MPAMFIGGAERSLIGLLKALDQSRCETYLFLYRQEGEFLGMIPPQVHLLSEIPAYAAIEKPIRSILLSRQFAIAFARLAAKFVTAFRGHFLGIKGFLLVRSVRYCLPFLPRIPGEYDLAIGFMTPHDTVLDRVTARRRAGWIHTDYGEMECGVDTAFELPMWRRLDAIAAVSDEVKNTFSRVFPELANKVVAAGNILCPEFIRQQAETDVSREMPPEPGGVLLCSAGRFCHAKNFDSVPEMVRRLKGLGIRVKWYLIGYGSDEPLIRAKIAAAGVGDQVIVLGKKANPYPYIKACDLYVQPSRYEGRAVTIPEAQILGKPVLITAFPTAKSQLEDGVDGIIAPLDIDGCVKKLKIVIEDAALRERLSANCLERDYSNRNEINKIYAMAEQARL